MASDKTFKIAVIGLFLFIGVVGIYAADWDQAISTLGRLERVVSDFLDKLEEYFKQEQSEGVFYRVFISFRRYAKSRLLAIGLKLDDKELSQEFAKEQMKKFYVRLEKDKLQTYEFLQKRYENPTEYNEFKTKFDGILEEWSEYINNTCDQLYSFL